MLHKSGVEEKHSLLPLIVYKYVWVFGFRVATAMSPLTVLEPPLTVVLDIASKKPTPSDDVMGADCLPAVTKPSQQW